MRTGWNQDTSGQERLGSARCQVSGVQATCKQYTTGRRHHHKGKCSPIIMHQKRFHHFKDFSTSLEKFCQTLQILFPIISINGYKTILAYQDKLFISITFISKFSLFHWNRIIILCMIIMFIHQNIYQYLSYINNNFYIAVVTKTNISNYLFLYSKNTFLQNYVQSIFHISTSSSFRFFTNL